MLSDLSIRRPVLATVLSLLVIVAGLIAFRTLPLRELPDVDRPIVSVDVSYRGASSQVIETQVTRRIEDALSGIEGIDTITSSSRDGRGSVNVEFSLGRDLDAAANDVRAAVDRVRGQLPPDVEDPVITKTDADADPFIWYSLESTTLDRVALTDFAERSIVDQLSVIDGVASVRVGGGLRPALRIWLDPGQLAARGLTVDDIERALRAQNVELPAGNVEAQERDYQIRTARLYQTPEEFARLPVTRPGAAGGAVVRLGDVARVEIAPEDQRRMFRGNGVDQIGLGIVRQSRSNALEVGNAVKAELERLAPTLPEGTRAVVSFDSTVFIEAAIEEVWKTLGEATVLVVIVIFLFLGSFRAALIPAAVIPVSLIGSFAVLAALGFSINLLTLLALVLAIGLVVDDSIVVLENAQRRIDELGEPRAVAALRGTRQVFFAVLATSAVIVAVFTPFFFIGGYVGRLFVELAVTVAATIVISTFVALTLSPMMCSKLLRPVDSGRGLAGVMDRILGAVRAGYSATLSAALEAKVLVFVLLVAIVGAGVFAFLRLPAQLTPPEDRGNLFVVIEGPEGAGFAYTSRVVEQVEEVFLGYVESGEARRVLVIAPSFGDQGTRFSSGFARVFLSDWGERRPGDEIVGELNQRFSDLPGANVRVIMQNPFAARGGGAGASIVLLGSDYAALSGVADQVVAAARQNPIFVRPRSNFEPNAARILVQVDRERAAALGVTVQAVARALEATMGQRRINTFERDGEEYNIYMQAERDQRSEVDDLTNMFVRSDRTGELIPLSSVVTSETIGDTAERRRFGRLAAVTVGVSLPPGVAIGTAIDELTRLANEAIGDQNIRVDYSGEAREFRQASGQILFAFLFALVIVFLVLAAQFESFINPLIIMLAVPLAIAGGVLGLYFMEGSLNIYSQIGLIILIALSAKNGILIVEFANQLRDEGRTVREAILEASALRLRPVLMTSIATVIGALPLMYASGAGAESRQTIGVVIVFGLLISTVLTLYIVPTFYDIMARLTRSPESARQELEAFEGGAEGVGRPAE
jgi:multidrug efflux pump